MPLMMMMNEDDEKEEEDRIFFPSKSHYCGRLKNPCLYLPKSHLTFFLSPYFIIHVGDAFFPFTFWLWIAFLLFFLYMFVSCLDALRKIKNSTRCVKIFRGMNFYDISFYLCLNIHHNLAYFFKMRFPLVILGGKLTLCPFWDRNCPVFGFLGNSLIFFLRPGQGLINS